MNNSTIEIQKPDIRLKIVLSISGMITLVILALIFGGVATYVFSGLGTVAIAGYGVRVWFKYETDKRLLRQQEAETVQIEEKALQEKLITKQMSLALRLHETKTGVFVWQGMEDWTFIPATATERKQLLPPVIEQPATLPDLLDEIRDEQCVMFLGPRDSGKTTLALHWLSVRDTQAIVCDVKGFNPWPGNCQVVSEIGDIVKTSQFVLTEMNRRREGQLRNEPSLTLFFDELHFLVGEGVEVLPMAIQIATLGREYNVHSGFTSHSDTVKYLKIEGAALLENFTKVRVTKKHVCYLDFGEGEQEVINPGPYHKSIPKQYPDILHVPTSEGELIEQAILKGDSNYKIAKDIFGYANGEIYKKIDVIRENSTID